MTGTSPIAVAPRFVAGLVAPTGVDEPTGFGLTCWSQQFETFETRNIGQARHPSCESLDDFVASLWWNL